MTTWIAVALVATIVLAGVLVARIGVWWVFVAFVWTRTGRPGYPPVSLAARTVRAGWRGLSKPTILTLAGVLLGSVGAQIAYRYADTDMSVSTAVGLFAFGVAARAPVTAFVWRRAYRRTREELSCSSFTDAGAATGRRLLVTA